MGVKMERYVRIEDGKVVAEFVWSDHILTWNQNWVRSDTLQIGDDYVEGQTQESQQEQ